METRPLLPFVEDRDTRAFFEAAREHRLIYRACQDCGRGLHPPTAHCPWCGGWNTDWLAAKGGGKLHSWTTVTHPIHPAYETPYTLVLVELDESPDVRLVGRVDGAPALRAGMRMQVWFETVAENVVLPQWRPAQA